ncbi:mCG7469 [Mus musculus]|nr:mCG7469 [Mus musculus]
MMTVIFVALNASLTGTYGSSALQVFAPPNFCLCRPLTPGFSATGAFSSAAGQMAPGHPENAPETQELDSSFPQHRAKQRLTLT